MNLLLPMTNDLDKKVFITLLLLFCLFSSTYSCNGNCRQCGRSAKMISLQDNTERTFGIFLPCCIEQCTEAGALTGITNSKCGVKKAGTKIVNGDDTEKNEYPWAVALAYRNGETWAGCGGALIASRWVITAHHCLDKATNGNFAVIIGAHNLRDKIQDQANGLERKLLKVDRIIRHELYNANSYEYDIALLRIQESDEVDLTKFTPVCLPGATETFDGKNAQVYGWGITTSTSNDKQPTSALRDATVKVVSNTDCESNYHNQNLIKPNMLCAGDDLTNGVSDACQGDSGGPLSYSDPSDKRHKLIGIVSWGAGCAQEKYPGVYTNVAKYRSWIEEKIRNCGGGVFEEK